MTEPQTQTTITSNEEAAEMERQLATWRAQQKAEADAARAAKLQPLRDIVNTPEYTAIVDGLTALYRSRDFIDEPGFYIHLQNAISVLPSLRTYLA